jgi:hypothetical protein
MRGDLTLQFHRAVPDQIRTPPFQSRGPDKPHPRCSRFPSHEVRQLAQEKAHGLPNAIGSLHPVV